MKTDIKNIWDDVYQKKELPWVNIQTPKDILNDFINCLDKGDSILDYGCGEGQYESFFIEKGCKVTGSDISQVALNIAKKRFSEIEFIQTDTPMFFNKNHMSFDGIFVWGVMHHIEKSKREEFLRAFFVLLESDGTILISGHSSKDKEFKKGYRISPTTGIKSYAVDQLDEVLSTIGFKIHKQGYYQFEESFSGKERTLKYFILKK